MVTLERRILDKLESIETRLERLERKTKKQGLSFEACIPPTYLCREIVVNCLGNFDNPMLQLSDYYGIKPMRNLHNPARVPKNAVACYHSFDDVAYYKESNSEDDVVLHEFFHHLHAHGVVNLNGKKEEVLADKFAKLVVQRGKS